MPKQKNMGFYLFLKIYVTLALIVVAQANIITVPHHDTVEPADPIDSLLPTREQCGKKAVINRRMIGGDTVDYSAFPWFSVLRKYNQRTKEYSKFVCGGTLINNRYILTAAHCLKDHNENDDLGENILVVHNNQRVHRIKLHENFTSVPFAANYDIALMRLTHRMKYSNDVQPVCLPEPNEKLSPLQMVTLLGVGLIIDFYFQFPKLPQKVELPVTISFKECEDVFKFDNANLEEDKNFCADKIYGKSACKGDSGGPAAIKDRNNTWIQHGIISVGPRECTQVIKRFEKHMGFVKVAAFLDWIKKNIKLMEK